MKKFQNPEQTIAKKQVDQSNNVLKLPSHMNDLSQ